MQNIKSRLPSFLGSLTFWVSYGLFCIFISLYAMCYFFHNSALGDAFRRTSYESMMSGKAFKPFVYRQLVPQLTHAVLDVTPIAVAKSFNKAFDDFKYDKRYRGAHSLMPWLQKTFPDPERHYARFVSSVIIWLFLLGYMGLLYALGMSLYPNNRALALFAPFFGVYAFTSFGFQWQYLYDIPVLCLSAACFYCIYTQKYRAYLACFLLYCLNKETAVLSAIFFFVWNLKRMEGKKFVVLMTLLGAIFVSVKMALTMHFANNAGVFLETNWFRMMNEDILGNANTAKIVNLCVLWFLITYGWKEKPEYLKTSLVLVPVMILAYVLFGIPHEYRVFFDLHPPLVLLAVHTLVIGTGISSSSFKVRKAT